MTALDNLSQETSVLLIITLKSPQGWHVSFPILHSYDIGTWPSQQWGWSPPESMACWEPTGPLDSVRAIRNRVHCFQKSSKQFVAFDPDLWFTQTHAGYRRTLTHEPLSFHLR